MAMLMWQSHNLTEWLSQEELVVAQPMPMQQSTDATCVLTWTREVPQTDKGVLPPPTEDSVKVVKQRLSPKTLRAHEAKMASCDSNLVV